MPHAHASETTTIEAKEVSAAPNEIEMVAPCWTWPWPWMHRLIPHDGNLNPEAEAGLHRVPEGTLVLRKYEQRGRITTDIHPTAPPKLQRLHHDFLVAVSAATTKAATQDECLLSSSDS